MKSPFEIFRRHQRMAMVVLVFMAMFAFVVLDSVQQMPDLPTPVMAFALGALLAGVFWFMGSPKGQAKEYALLGAIIGVAAGFIGPQINRPPAAVETRFGRLTDRDMHREIQKRQQANQFLRAASEQLAVDYLKEHPELERMGGRFLNFYLTQLKIVVPPQYYFGLLTRTNMDGDETGVPLEEDVALGYVFRHEADRLGIVVSREMVTQYLQDATNNKLSVSSFYDLLERMNLSDKQLYDVVADQLKAQMAFNMLAPRNLPTPDQLWEYHKKMNVRQALDLTAIPVSAFAKDIPDPTPGELEPFFNAYASRFPTNEVTPEPAFGLPRRVKVGWLESDYKTAAAAVTAQLDMQIAAAADAGRDGPIEEFYEKNKDILYLNRDFPSDAKFPDPGSGPVLKAPEFPGLKDLDARPPEKPSEKPPEKPTDDAKPESKSDSPEGDKSPEDEDELDEEAEPPADPKNEKPADAPPAPKDGRPADKPVAENNDEPAAAPADDAAIAEVPGEPLPDAAPKPKYRPLDLALREEIRGRLIEERAEVRLRERSIEAQDQVRKVAGELVVPDPRTRHPVVSAEKVAEKLRAWATEKGYTYGESDLVSYDQLISDDYPVGRATELDSDLGNRQIVAQLIFGAGAEQRFVASAASDPTSSDHYVYWKIDDVPPRKAELTDPGMRERAIAAWKESKAREPAKKRADAVALLFQNAEGKELTEVVAGQTVTGRPDDQQLTIRDTETFSWIRQSSALAPNPLAGRPAPELSTISSVEKAGQEFFETVFDKLREGESGVAPNADHSIYYIVRVKDRVPATDAGEDELRKQFLARPHELFSERSPYMHLARQDFQPVFERWRAQIDREYAIDWTGLRSRRSE